MRVVPSVLLGMLICNLAAAQQKRVKIIADQDSAGPQGTNFLSLLMLLRAPQIDLLGITTISGDQWVEPATVFALWSVEQAGRPDVPVIKGAEMPLLNTPREQELREALYGSLVGWHGSFNPDAPDPKQTWAPPGGFPKHKPKPGRAADFIADTIRANPGEVVLYCAGPLTNIALAIRMDPEIVRLTKAIYIMGGSSSGGPELTCGREHTLQFFIYLDTYPNIQTLAGSHLGVSTGLLELLKRDTPDNAEFNGLVAHELARDIQKEGFLTAWKNEDLQTLKAYELFYDAVATATMNHLRMPSQQYALVLQRMIAYTRGHNTDHTRHPDLETRQSLIRAIGIPFAYNSDHR